MKVINLLPKTEEHEIKLQLAAGQLLNFWFYVAISMGVLLLLSLMALVFLRTTITSADNDIAQKKAELASSDTQKLQNSVVSLNNQIKGIVNLTGANYHWSKAIEELTFQTPDGAHLSSVDFDRSSGKIQVSGIADTREEVIQFWANIHKSNYFRNINFPFTNLEKEQNSPFTYTFYVNSDMIKNESPK